MKRSRAGDDRDLRRKGDCVANAKNPAVGGGGHCATCLVSQDPDICLGQKVSCQTQMALADAAQADDEDAVNQA